MSILVISKFSIAGQTVYVWKSKGINTYSDVPPTKGYDYGTVVDEDTVMMQKKATSQNSEQDDDVNLNITNTTDSNQNNKQDTENCAQAQNNLNLAQQVQDAATRTTLINLYQTKVNKYCY
ncbi:MAG: hypothetical protein GKC53_00805 [Neisseriaceae bacterium]|nr:MAG: hypothetical protein GKC53_00805 [Neisseriaceae bacterium]